jgi:phosphoenolpyruvate-protein phosphotransferase (PTS system enzyme I)
MFKGIAVSPGVSIGIAYCIHEVFVDPGRKLLEPNEVPAELARFENARKKSIAEIRGLHRKVARQVGEDAAAIFAVHESILQDPALVGKVRASITEERLTAPAALERMVDFYKGLLDRSGDEYLRERIADIRDVVERLTSHLSVALQRESGVLSDPVIVIADELLPSQVLMLGSKPVSGIVTQAGSQTSHAAIVARGRGIPAVSGVRGILRQTKTGDLVIVDGREGHVLVNPDAEQLAAFRKLEREFVNLRDQLAHNHHLPAITADGHSLELLANINGISDARAAVAMGAIGVGLYRTEYLYMAHASVPSEQEQLENYQEVIAASPNHNVTIRTLDIGGDKSIPFLGRGHYEANPFMGWRSIRLSFEYPQFFLSQIRAILRAAAEAPVTSNVQIGNSGETVAEQSKSVKLMFPMVTTLEELRKLKAMVHRAERQLTADGIPHGRVDFGMMLEVPAAAVMIEQMLPAVDFVSIGSNDLVQYLMAADRDNPKVSHLCQPLSPAVLRVLWSVVGACNRQNKPVTLCGEMAGLPQALAVLLGMGLRRFSVSPAVVPTVKEVASHLTIPMAEELLKRALQLKTSNRIRNMLNAQLLEIAPKLSPILMQ